MPEEKSTTVKRLLRLRKNAIDHTNKTGYPHLDASHLQFYTEQEIKNYEFPDMSMYGLVYDRIIKNGYHDLIAMEYFGRKITYSAFLDSLADYSSAFLNIGIQPGEIVSVTCPNIPEAFCVIYALNKIGAVANLIDPRNNLERIKLYINQAGSTRLIMLDIVYPKIAKIIGDTAIKEVYTLSAADSLPLGLKALQTVKTRIENRKKGLPSCPHDAVFRPLAQTVAKYRNAERDYLPLEQKQNRSVKDDVAVIINTSGTTGTPKGVMLTNENFNAIGYNYINTNINFEYGDGFLGFMPNFLAYGMGFGIHMPFVMGLKNILIPSFDPKDFPKLILKYRPAHFAGVPFYYQFLMEDKKVQRSDLSFIKNACAGGDTMDPELKRKTNDFLAAHNCPNKIRVGYGLSENAGMSTSQYYIGESTELNELYTVGIPSLYNNVKIVSPETGEALKVNQDGEVLIFGKSVMKGYLNNPEETAKVIEEVDGVRYLHTGDIGHVDEEGLVYILNRLKRIIIRPDGHNVFPVYIERVIAAHPHVRECICVGVKDRKYMNGRLPVAFLTLEKGYESQAEQIIDELKKLSLEKLPERDVAMEYVVLDELPITDNGKVDFVSLEAYELKQ